MPAGFLEMHLQALSVRASRSFPDIKSKKHKKAPLRSGAVLKKRLAREINEIEIFRNIQQISLRRCHTFRNHLQNFGEFVSSFYKI